MPNTIQNKRSSTENNRPDAGDLLAGEIAINTNEASANVHFEDASGNVRSVGSDPTDAGTYVRDVSADGEVGTWVAANAVPGEGDGSGDYGFWNRDDGTDTISPRQADDNLNLGSGALDSGDITSSGGGTFTGKVTSAATEDADADETLVTKGYVDNLPSGGVTRIIAGTNVTINPTTGTGDVTVNATGGGGDGDVINYNGAAAWGGVNPDGTAFGSGLNFTSSRTSTGLYQITFVTPMPSDDYSIQATTLSTIDHSAVAGGKTATGFLVRTFRDGVGLADIGFTFTVQALNALPPRGGTGADGWAATSADGTIKGSFNFTDANVRVAEGNYRYTFLTPMPSSDYAVVVTQGALNQRSICVRAKTVDGFNVQIRNSATTSPDLLDAPHDVVVHATNAQLPDTITQEELDAALNSPGVSAWGNISKEGNIYSSLNVGSITKTNTGSYLITFANPMPNDHYSVVATGNIGDGNVNVTIGSQDANSFAVYVKNLSADILEDREFYFTVCATNAQPPKGGTGADAWCSVGGDANIQQSFNIASCTLISIGVYEYTFTTPMPNKDYAVVAQGNTGIPSNTSVAISGRETTGFTVHMYLDGVNDNRSHSVVVHATNAQLPNTVTQEQIDYSLSNSCAAWGVVDNLGNKVGSGLNFTSVRNSEGNYTITFDNPMPNAQYSVTTSEGTHTIGLSPFIISVSGTRTATEFTVDCRRASDGVAKDIGFNFAVFATNAPVPRGGSGADAWGFHTPDATGRAGYNVASIVKNSQGNYTATFITPMPSDEYAVVVTPQSVTGNVTCQTISRTADSITYLSRVASTDATVDAACQFVVHATNATLPAPLSQDDLLFVDGRNAATGTQEFQAGVNVTGGDVVIENSCQMDGIAKFDAIDGIDVIVNAQIPNGATNEDGNNLVGFLYSGQDLQGGKLDTLAAFAASNVGQGEINYGFYSETNQSASGKQNFAFYSAGDAFNYFKGNVKIQGGSVNEQSFVEIGNNSDSPFLQIRRQGSTQAGVSAFSIAASANNPQVVYSISYSGVPSTFFSLNAVDAVAITDACETVKAFTPSTAGFSGQDFVDYLPSAIDPETLTENGVMVSESKMIPLLTKALQEALERIEALEAAAADGGTKPTRKRKS